MRVLFLTSTFEPLTGGAETYARLLTRGLADAGHEVTIVTDGSWVEGLPRDRAENGCRVLRLRDFATEVRRKDKVVWRQMQYAHLKELGDVFAGESFDLVHTNSHETLIMGAVVAEDLGAALVASLHEQNPDLEAFGRGKCRLAYGVLPVDLHLAASRFYRDRARQYGVPEERLRLVYHGVGPAGPASDRAAARRRFGIADTAEVVVCAGRIYTRKGQTYLARAFERLRARRADAHLFLAGRISDFDYADEVFALLGPSIAEGAVTVEQELTLADMPEVFACADLAVQPSLEEGLGLAAIEAMQHGVPVVASDVVGLDEVVTHERDGLLVPAKSTEDLFHAMERVLADRALAERLSAGGRRTAARVFSVETMVESTIAAYADALRLSDVR